MMSMTKRRALGTVLTGLSGALVAGIVGLTGSGGAAASAGAVRPAPSPITDIAQPLSRNLAMDRVVAQATRGTTAFILAPGVGQFAHPGDLCFAVIDASEMSGPGFRPGPTSSLACGPAASWEANGTMATQRDPAGNVTVWGFVPLGTTRVTAAGREIPLTGRFFDTGIARTVRVLLLTTPAGQKTLDVAPVPPE